MLLIKPYLGCNISCTYCYEHPYRNHHEVKLQYDLDAVIAKIDELTKNNPSLAKGPICLHGGEILCLPKNDVEALLKKAYDICGSSSIQTNATQIDDDFIKLFKKYNTSVGVSWDGPGDLSSFRPGTEDTERKMKWMLDEGISVSNIIIVSKANAGTPDKIKRLKEWLLELKRLNIKGRINPCTNSLGQELEMESMKEFYLDMIDFMIENELTWSPFSDVINGLKKASRVCVFTQCDIYSTPSATVILGDGTVTNCMRTNNEFVTVRDEKPYNTRNEILHQVPQEHGGCKGCDFFESCYGGCPTTAIDGDWRNRTYLCPLWKVMFGRYKKIFDHLLIDCDSQQNGKNGGRTGGYNDHGHSDALHGDYLAAKGENAENKGCERRHGDAPHGDHGDSDQNRNTELPHGHGDSGFVYGDHGHSDALHADHSNNSQ